ncbi:MAG TPA: phage major capsid protein [Solirubrobacteraceae bacterium]|nr:phage major capsid protein [Solirubrobacteraceae bacterium]
MPNAIPLLEGTPASGGYLVPTEYVQNAFQRGIDRQSAVASLSQVRRVSGKQVQFTEYVGRPVAAFVAEGAAKPATGAEYAPVTVDIKKIAATVMYTEELIEDAQDDPTLLVNQDVRASIADLIDAHALGMTSAGALVSQFNTELVTTTQTVEYVAADADGLADAVSAAMEMIEANGYMPNGAILARDGRAVLRNARDADGRPLYGMGGGGFTTPTQEIWGVPIRYSTNLQTFAGAAAVGRVVGVVGDFSGAMLAVRNDIRVKFSDQATIDVAGTKHDLWQQNKVASLWECRVGFVAHDLNRRFVAILNAV